MNFLLSLLSFFPNFHLYQLPTTTRSLDTDDIHLAREALEVLSLSLAISPQVLTSLETSQDWKNFVIDSLLLIRNRYFLDFNPSILCSLSQATSFYEPLSLHVYMPWTLCPFRFSFASHIILHMCLYLQTSSYDSLRSTVLHYHKVQCQHIQFHHFYLTSLLCCWSECVSSQMEAEYCIQYECLYISDTQSAYIQYVFTKIYLSPRITTFEMLIWVCASFLP